MSNPSASVVAIVLAEGEGSGLHELTDKSCAAALPFACGARIVDWTLDNLARSRIAMTIAVVRPEHHVFAGDLALENKNRLGAGRLTVRYAPPLPRGATLWARTLSALSSLTGEIARLAPQTLLVIAADHVCRIDLDAFLGRHRSGACPVSIAMLPPGREAVVRLSRMRDKVSAAPLGILAFDWDWLRAWLAEADSAAPAATAPVGGGDGASDGAADGASDGAADGTSHRARAASVDPQGEVGMIDVTGEAAERATWHDVAGLDAFRQSCIDLERSAAAKASHDGADPTPGAALVTRIAETDSVILAGALVSKGTRLRNAIVAPGAIVPSEVQAGHDAAFDALWFRVTPAGTVLITPRMLARRTQDSMRRILLPNHPKSLTLGHHR